MPCWAGKVGSGESSIPCPFGTLSGPKVMPGGNRGEGRQPGGEDKRDRGTRTKARRDSQAVGIGCAKTTKSLIARHRCRMINRFSSQTELRPAPVHEVSYTSPRYTPARPHVLKRSTGTALSAGPCQRRTRGQQEDSPRQLRSWTGGGCAGTLPSPHRCCHAAG
jgi:hypothetical protein